MTFADDMWLRATATQRTWSHLVSYGAAFYGTAALQTWKLGLDGPMTFWQAMSRVAADDTIAAPPPSTRSKPSVTKPAAKASPKPKAKVVKEEASKPKAKAIKEEAPKPKAKVAELKAVAPKIPEPKAEEAARVAKPSQPKPAEKAVSETKADVAPAAKNANPHLLDAPRSGKSDDLTVMSGVGEKLALVMNDFGIYHFDQIAGLTDEGIDWLNAQQPGFKAVIKRFDLVGQAKDLAT